LAFSAVALASLAPKMLGSYRQRFAVYIWIGVMIFVFSYLVKVFKYKNGGGSQWLAGVFPSVCSVAGLIQGVLGLDRLPIPSLPRIDAVVIYVSDRNINDHAHDSARPLRRYAETRQSQLSFSCIDLSWLSTTSFHLAQAFRPSGFPSSLLQLN
jgi:hypothetical protein